MANILTIGMPANNAVLPLDYEVDIGGQINSDQGAPQNGVRVVWDTNPHDANVLFRPNPVTSANQKEQDTDNNPKDGVVRSSIRYVGPTVTQPKTYVLSAKQDGTTELLTGYSLKFASRKISPLVTFTGGKNQAYTSTGADYETDPAHYVEFTIKVLDGTSAVSGWDMLASALNTNQGFLSDTTPPTLITPNADGYVTFTSNNGGEATVRVAAKSVGQFVIGFEHQDGGEVTEVAVYFVDQYPYGTLPPLIFPTTVDRSEGTGTTITAPQKLRTDIGQYGLTGKANVYIVNNNQIVTIQQQLTVDDLLSGVLFPHTALVQGNSNANTLYYFVQQEGQNQSFPSKTIPCAATNSPSYHPDYTLSRVKPRPTLPDGVDFIYPSTVLNDLPVTLPPYNGQAVGQICKVTVYLNGKNPDGIDQPRVLTLRTDPPTVTVDNASQVAYVPSSLFIGYASDGLFEAEYVIYTSADVEINRTLIFKCGMQTWPGTA